MITKYITLDDIKEYAGIDLKAELGSTEAAQAFLMRIEVRMESFLNARMHQNVSVRYPNFTDSQKYHYKLALLEQAIYIWKNGDISVDNGYDPHEGVKIDPSSLLTLQISRNAKEHLIQAGLWTYKLGPKGFFGDFFEWYW